MDDIAVKVENVSKLFKLPHEKTSSIKSAAIHFYSRKKNYEMQQALKDVSFEVKKGEFYGIVGRNGSGKSTMLKLLAGIYAPSEGTVQVNGKLTPFIELGVGFNPELTGRENIYLNGALLGFSRKQMQSMYKDIVEFAELEKFMDQKLKNYSSGMQVRLAFSIAIKAKNDILIFDEVLAVGDEAFQRKCFDVFEQYKAEKQTVIIVTHDMETVRNFCGRAMLLDSGNVIDIGDPRVVSEKYSKLNQEIIDEIVAKDNSKVSGAKYLKAKVLDAKNQQKVSFNPGEKAFVDLSWKGLTPTLIESIGVNIFKASGEHITGVNTRDAQHSKDWKEKGSIVLELDLNIKSGKYYILVEAFQDRGQLIDSIQLGPQFNIKKGNKWSGLVKLPYHWHEKN